MIDSLTKSFTKICPLERAWCRRNANAIWPITTVAGVSPFHSMVLMSLCPDKSILAGFEAVVPQAQYQHSQGAMTTQTLYAAPSSQSTAQPRNAVRTCCERPLSQKWEGF